MSKDESTTKQQPSSDAIVAEIIDDVRQKNVPFDVKNLIGGNFEVTGRKGLHSTRNRESESDESHSSSHRRNKKLKRHKEKKSKKSKKSKHKVRSNSRSPSRKKKRHHHHSHSRKSGHGSNEKLVNYAIPPSVEAVMEKISDDEDEIAFGADYLSINAGSSKIDEKSEELLQDITSAVQNKTKEFKVDEEVFPLSKKKKKSESPPVLRKPRPLSEILANVRAERNSALVPRNVKLKRETVKSAGESTANVISHTVPKNDGGRFDDSTVEYGPKPLQPPGPQPISDDDDELQLAPLKIQPREASKSIKIGTISKMSLINNKKSQLGENGEIPVSDISVGPSSSNGDSVFGLHDDKHTKSEMGISDEEDEIKRKADEKKRKGKKDKKRDKRYRKRSDSSSSDSEVEWKRLGKRNKGKEHSRYSVREFDKNRRRGSLYVQSYYVDSNKRLHEGSKKHWSREEKDVRDKTGIISTHNRSKGWRHVRTARSPYSERKRKRSSSSSHSRSRSRTRSMSESSSRSSHSSHHRRTRSSHRRSSYRHHYRRSNSKRRSDDESSSHKIDKKKLLEIARRNAAQIAQHGHLPNAFPETGTQLKTGGQSVNELVSFCQRLQRSQDKDARREKGETVSSDDEDLAPRKKKGEDDTDFVKHPFALKTNVPITINVPNFTPLPIRTPAQRNQEEGQLRITFPVSSGMQHREKDSEWTPVKKEEVPSVCNPAQKAKLAATPARKEKEKILNAFEIGISEPFKLPPPPPPPMLAPFTQSASSFLKLPPPPPPPDLVGSSSGMSSHNQQQICSLGLDYGEIVTVPEEESVFKETNSLHHTPANVGKVMAKRIKANNLLAKDPNDYEARRMLKEADDQIKAWAESKKNLPGKFTGSTGVNVLKADQLGPEFPRFNVWAKKDFFKQASAVNSGVGLKLMQKMGWSPGEGLGKGKDGPREPLMFGIKSDRKGLVATEELSASKKLRLCPGNNISGKHPVSILMEYCSKNRWPAPQFKCVESGPSNNRRFLWTAVVNGIEYQPAVPSTSKKTGKAQACQVVLQSLGLASSDPPSPIVL